MPLTHVDEAGDARMVEVQDKPITARIAVAQGFIGLGPEALALVRSGRAKKGDVLGVAQIAGIQGAKRASDLIPLCHPLPLTGVDVRFRLAEDGLWCEATARATWRTGVEMEALAAVSAALLTVYDMLKAVDKGMTLGPIQLLHKRGGRSGDWSRERGTP